MEEFPKRNLKDPEHPWSHDARVVENIQTGQFMFKGQDGIMYEFDMKQNAWFPMFNEDLISMQQSVYSVPGVDEQESMVLKNKQKKLAMKQEQKKAHEEQEKLKNEKRTNTAVYVSHLPLDATFEEMSETFGKFGLILEDLETGKPKIKLYTNEQGEFKGDALVVYYKPESVQLCIDLLDDTEFRYGDKQRIRVEPAKFTEKEKNSIKKLDKKKIQKARERMERKLEWQEEQEQTSEKLAKMVILKHMFTLDELNNDPTLLLDLKQDVREECEKLGVVTNVILYDLEPDGIMAVKFKDAQSVDLCIKKMNGRYFSGRRIEAYRLEKRMKFKKSSNVQYEDEDERLKSFEEWVENQ